MGDDGSALFRSLYPSLRAFAAVVGSWEEEPDDLVQEALARTLRHHRLEDLDAPAAYLRTAVVHVAISSRRRRSARRRAWSRDVPSEPVRDALPSDLADLERLGAVDRALLYLVHVEGRSHREAGELLGVSEQASRSRTSRAAKQLREQITEEEAAR